MEDTNRLPNVHCTVSEGEAWFMKMTHSGGGVQYYKKYKTSKEVLEELKNTALRYMIHSHRYTIKSVNGECIICEENKGVIDSWSTRKVRFINQMLEGFDFEKYRSDYKKTMQSKTQEYVDKFSSTDQILLKVKGAEDRFEQTRFIALDGEYNEKILAGVGFGLGNETLVTLWSEDVEIMTYGDWFVQSERLRFYKESERLRWLGIYGGEEQE